MNCHNPCDSLLLLFHCLLGKHVFDYVIHLLNLSRITVRFEKRENVKVSLAIDDLHHSTHSTLLSVVETVLYVSVNKSLSAERPRFLCSDLIQVSVKIHPNNYLPDCNTAFCRQKFDQDTRQRIMQFNDTTSLSFILSDGRTITTDPNVCSLIPNGSSM